MATDIRSSENRQFRLAGEDAPLWPVAAFGLFGAALAFAASAQIFDPPAASAPATIPVAVTIPAPVSAPAVAPVTAPKASVCLPVVSIPFDFNSARLNTAGLDETIAPQRAWLTEHKEAVLSVEGRADASGDETSNVVLSYKRAQATAAWLTQAGVATEQIAVRAGAPSRKAVNAASNRQVILQIEGVEPCREDGTPAQKP